MTLTRLSNSSFYIQNRSDRIQWLRLEFLYSLFVVLQECLNYQLKITIININNKIIVISNSTRHNSLTTEGCVSHTSYTIISCAYDVISKELSCTQEQNVLFYIFHGWYINTIHKVSSVVLYTATHSDKTQSMWFQFIFNY